MGMGMQQPQIDYAPDLPIHKWRRTARRVTVGAIALLIVFLAAKSAPSAWRHVQVLYWQRQAMNYSPAADRVVYDDDPAEAAKLRAADHSLIVGGHGEAFEFATPWDRLYQLISPPGQQPAATLFLHERQNRKGERRLVVVQAQPYGGSIPLFSNTPGSVRQPNQPFAMDAVVLLTGTAFRLPRELGGERASTAIPAFIFPEPTHFRWYAGQVDPLDSAHFTIRGLMNERPAIVDGWLRDDDQVEFATRR
jgi:hypothetical protein